MADDTWGDDTQLMGDDNGGEDTRVSHIISIIIFDKPSTAGGGDVC